MRLYYGALLIRTLYLILFARYSASKISVSDLDLSGSPKVKYFYFFRKLICNFIMVLCWYELSMSYCLRDIPHLRFQLVTLTFQGHRRSNISNFWKAHMRLCNGLLLIRTLHLAPFTRYSLSTFWNPCQKLTFDLLKVKVLDWIQIFLNLSLTLAIALWMKYRASKSVHSFGLYL